MAIGTAYSVPPLRLKRSSLWAALSIALARGVIANVGIGLHYNDAFGGLEGFSPMTLAVLGAFFFAFGIVIAIYIHRVGADDPGGKFQGATILAAMWLLVIMAGLTDVPPASRTSLRLGLIAGPAVFIALGFVGAATTGAFLAWPGGLEKALIVVAEVALMPSLAITLGLLLAGAPQRPS
jgi:hypothetical protein